MCHPGGVKIFDRLKIEPTIFKTYFLPITYELTFHVANSVLYYEMLFMFRTGSKLGISPLMLAAMNGHVAAVKLLLDRGSDVNAQVREAFIFGQSFGEQKSRKSGLLPKTLSAENFVHRNVLPAKIPNKPCTI